MRKKLLKVLPVCLSLTLPALFWSAEAQDPPAFTPNKDNGTRLARYNVDRTFRNVIGVKTGKEHTHFVIDCAGKRRSIQAIYHIQQPTDFEGKQILVLRNGAGKDKNGDEIRGVSMGLLSKGSRDVEWRALANETIQPLSLDKACSSDGFVIPLTAESAIEQHEALRSIAERHITGGTFYKEAPRREP